MENKYNAGKMPNWNAFLREQLSILEKEKRVKHESKSDIGSAGKKKVLEKEAAR